LRVTRESVSVALFNLLAQNQQLATLCKTITRVPLMWTAVPETAKPYLLLFKGGPATESYEQPQDKRIALTKYVINYNLWLYLTADPSQQTVAETLINNIADGIDSALQASVQPPPGKPMPQGAFAERQTLGGLVNNCWLNQSSEWGREFEDSNITVFFRITVELGI
jgi:hypothetical protein